MKYLAVLFLGIAVSISGCQASVGVGGGLEIRVGHCAKCGYLHPANEPCPAQIPVPPKIRPHREIK